ncbi:hypothetical protein NEOLEDRAFT_855965 [Neolentinus lepideus HHB14362 ss-1]|uniref:Uncharacterized protein n=1 Tax=Neolentinus lepideus HHB14362 ss-1 TaxID=1314782 RepID=A0A165UQH8_9AGAM|nr:hypothetical protein NEOLEDRAFT_855965 [Neolentinus lepideus HHB14362 ss-1]
MLRCSINQLVCTYACDQRGGGESLQRGVDGRIRSPPASAISMSIITSRGLVPSPRQKTASYPEECRPSGIPTRQLEGRVRWRSPGRATSGIVAQAVARLECKYSIDVNPWRRSMKSAVQRGVENSKHPGANSIRGRSPNLVDLAETSLLLTTFSLLVVLFSGGYLYLSSLGDICSYSPRKFSFSTTKNWATRHLITTTYLPHSYHCSRTHPPGCLRHSLDDL